MIYLLSKTVYSGDALTRLGIKGTFPMHEYYTIGIRAEMEICDIIREQNIVKVTYHEPKCILLSGNPAELSWLISMLTAAGHKPVADAIKSVLPVNTTTAMVKA